MQKQIRPLVLVGPSGSGKTTFINKLLAHPFFKLSVSMTTRKPRATEVDGRQYIFVSKEQFEKSIKDGVFLQHCQVHDNFYGTSKNVLDQVKSQGLICLLDIDVQGAQKVHNSSYPCNFVFIMPESVEQLGRRLRHRGLDSEQVILKRMQNAQKQIKKGKELKFFQYIQNIQLEKALLDLQDYIRGKYSLDLKL